MKTAIPYEKWDATGNDFVLVDLAKSPIAEEDFSADLVSRMCDRTEGVGADGVVLLRKKRVADGPSEVVILNSDGSRGDMCGNALRCVALVLDRDPGPSHRSLLMGGRRLETWSLDEERSAVLMGKPAAEGSHPIFDSLPELDRVMGATGYLLSFGNPHYVVPFAEIPESWETLGSEAQAVAHRLLGTGGINCGFLRTRPQDDGSYLLRVFERGAGATLSCGSGACAASAVLEQKLAIAAPHLISLPGGVLTIGRTGTHEDQGTAGLEMAGSATLQFRGEWSIG